MRFYHPSRYAILFVALTAIAGCSGDAEEAEVAVTEESEAGAAMDPAAMPMMEEDTLAQRMEAHMASLEGVNAQQLKAILPEHSRMVNAMIEDCRAMMRQMNMQAPAAFTELEDAIRADLTRMEQMPDDQLMAFLPEHRGRLQNMMQMRHDMMM